MMMNKEYFDNGLGGSPISLLNDVTKANIVVEVSEGAQNSGIYNSITATVADISYIDRT